MSKLSMTKDQGDGLYLGCFTMFHEHSKVSKLSLNYHKRVLKDIYLYCTTFSKRIFEKPNQ